MQDDLFGATRGVTQGNPERPGFPGPKGPRAPGAPRVPGVNPGQPGAAPGARGPGPGAERQALVQELRRQIEALTSDLLRARDEAEQAKKVASGPMAAFLAAHEEAVLWCRERGSPPYGPEDSAAFRSLIAIRDERSRAAYPLRKAQDHAERVAKALVSELRGLNMELEQHERLLG